MPGDECARRGYERYTVQVVVCWVYISVFHSSAICSAVPSVVRIRLDGGV